jgi:hypothetical protein
MALIITKGMPETYKLEQSDPSGETFVTVKPATVAENSQRDELWANQVRTYRPNNGDAVEVKSEATFAQRMALEIFLTMVDCNIQWQEQDADGQPKGDPKPLFKFAKAPDGASYLSMSRDEFARALGRLPSDVAYEIYGKVMEKNTQWDIFRS